MPVTLPTVGRSIERLVAAVALVVCWPLCLLLALCIRVSSPGPVLIRRRRPTASGRAVAVLEFRTVGLDGRAPTVLGRVLRRYGLYLMPSLVDVAPGELSLWEAALL